ncbi:Protein required for attachment to host cells [Jannaschia faecimaris]|uniref:Protein required for attachment to host cells n=1 Tax=Jannaschia faecimaris TaxID=1244108 RepID=A0A1H3S8X0_9RHOB|nr:host attachment protein [Jannaschia faecimaris]SDZ34197.1 Protein required for attachment to host cells [Jannaschia faecimaris]
MKRTKTWVIVADGQTARLFDLPFDRRKPLIPLEDHVWDALPTNAPADAQGVTHSSVGSSQHRLAPHNAPDKGPDGFAGEIASRLAASLKSGAFEKLVVVAAPRMMGFLRDRLDAETRASIWMEIDKDFTQMPLEKIDAALRKHLFS